MSAYYVPGMTLGWTRQANYSSSWDVCETHPSQCVCFCILFGLQIIPDENTAQGRTSAMPFGILLGTTLYIDAD